MNPQDNKPLSSVLFLAKIPMASASAAQFRVEDGKTYVQVASVPELDPDIAINLVAYDFEDELPENSIAFHPIYGSVMYDAYWWSFSTKRFMNNLQAAEANPNIIAHFIHVDSNGGEAFGCHEAFEMVRNLKKPCIALVDTMAASAGYYLACAAGKLYAGSKFSEIGCIGTMCVMENYKEYLEKKGIKEIEYYSNYSPLKNKVFTDALEGDGKDYVKRFLDPLAFQFISDVRATRTGVAEDSDAVKGEIFYADTAEEQGLCDGIRTIEEVVAELAAAAAPKKPAEPSIDINKIQL